MNLFMDLTAPMRAAGMTAHLARWRDQLDPMLLMRLDRAEAMSAIDWERATHRRTALWHGVRGFFERYDVLVTPTTSAAAFPIGQTFPAEIDGRPLSNQLEWFPFTYPFAITGQPAISVPAGFTAEGLPVGLQIVARHRDDFGVLQIARAYERARGDMRARSPLV